MSIAQLNALYLQASAALDGNDYDGAIRAAMQAKLRLATLPDVSRAVGQGSQQISWANAAAIDKFIEQVNKLAAAAKFATSGPFLSTRVAYARPASTGPDA